jgi:hypothetical protein
MGAIQKGQKRLGTKQSNKFTVPSTHKMPGVRQALSFGDLGSLIGLNIFVIRQHSAKRELRDAGFYSCSRVSGVFAVPWNELIRQIVVYVRAALELLVENLCRHVEKFEWKTWG